MNGLENIRNLYGLQFNQGFKTITGNNASEFANLSKLPADNHTKIYFTRPYSSFEKGTN